MRRVVLVGVVPGLAALLVFLFVGGGAASTREARQGCPSNTYLTRTPVGLPTALRSSIPRLFGDMTNQQGRGAWKGYYISAMFSLNRAVAFIPAPRPPAFFNRARYFARRKCGSRVARRSWAALVLFPNAGSARYGDFVIYAAKAGGRWHAWGTVNAERIFPPGPPGPALPSS